MARRHRPVVALDLDEAHAARRGGRALLVVAERGHGEAGALRGAEDGLARDRGDLLAVDPDRARGLPRRDLALMRDRRDLLLRGLRVSLEKAHPMSTLSSDAGAARHGGEGERGLAAERGSPPASRPSGAPSHPTGRGEGTREHARYPEKPRQPRWPRRRIRSTHLGRSPIIANVGHTTSGLASRA